MNFTIITYVKYQKFKPYQLKALNKLNFHSDLSLDLITSALVKTRGDIAAILFALQLYNSNIKTSYNL